MASPPTGRRRARSAPPIEAEEHHEEGSERHRKEAIVQEVQVPQTRINHARLDPRAHLPGGRKGRPRRRSPGVAWHKKWNQYSWQNGRVLIIDYVSREKTPEGRRKVVAQEFNDLEALEQFYNSYDRSQMPALRLIHVQNAPWATKLLLKKYHIDDREELVGTKFGRWAQYEKPQIRARKPVMKGKTWPPQRDPWRVVARAAFGVDYLKHFPAKRQNSRETQTDDELSFKMMELNQYNEIDEPAYGLDVFTQRLSVYVQRSEGRPRRPSDPLIKNPYLEADFDPKTRTSTDGPTTLGGIKGLMASIRSMDNGNAIIIFEHSHSGSVEDTLIGARQEIESRWRRLTFYLPREEASTDERLALECMDLILTDIFKALATQWDQYIDACETHVSILEDKIYENPADESRANELWTNSSLWLKVEKLMFLHIDVLKEMKSHLRELDDGVDPTLEWLGSIPEEFDKLSNFIQEEMVKPTRNLSDLMYKSVEIRDARESLQLNTSLWRLSWITFIFLPLTFLVGFFGMNVDTFRNDPSISWYFVVSIPFMAVVLIVWYIVKHFLSSQRQTPYERGVYEDLFYGLATKYPRLWSRGGPRHGVQPRGFFSKLKWRLITSWYRPSKTIRKPTAGDLEAELGVWAKFKYGLVRRWLKELHSAREGSLNVAELGELMARMDDGAVTEMTVMSPTASTAVGQTTGAVVDGERLGVRLARASSPRSSSGVMIDERYTSDDEHSFGSPEPRRPSA